MPEECEDFQFVFQIEEPAERERSIQAMPKFYDIYRTEPDESHRLRIGKNGRSPSATLTIRNNTDLRNYFVVQHGVKPSQVTSSDNIAGYDLWIQNSPKEATFFLFDMEYLCEGMKQRRDFLKNGYLITRNTMARTWEEAMVRQDNADYINGLSQAELEYNAREYDSTVDNYVSWMKNNHQWRVRGYLESLQPGEHRRRVQERRRI